jgi:HEPN domain-containing protein
MLRSGPHAAFLLHQATERYFHAVLLVFTGYKPKTHNIEELAEQTAPLHAALAGALPRTDPEAQRLFDLLKRAYIEARYSKSYRITAEELAILRRSVLDLAARVRLACAAGLSLILGADAVGPLPFEPTHEDSVELPSLPSLDDPQAVQTWRDALVRISYDRGEFAGRGDGLAAGRALAIVDVLRRRGVELSDEEVERIVACRDEAQLAGWWELAWSASAASDFVGLLS